MTEENQARKRRGQPLNQKEKEQKSYNSDESKKSDRSKPFQGRYNPKASDRYGMLSHKTLAKFVMLMGAVVFVIYSGYNKQNIHTMAKVEEVLEKPRHAQFMCHPHYKQVSDGCGWWAIFRVKYITPVLPKMQRKSLHQYYICLSIYCYSYICHLQEIQQLNPVCLPARCGRFISDSLVTVTDAHKLLNIAKKGLAKVIWFYYIILCYDHTT